MTNVLLTKKYRAHAAGEILRDLPEGEATALENIGVGQKLKEEKQPEPKDKGKKDASE